MSEEIVIRKLSPDLTDDYLKFMGGMVHTAGGKRYDCYCVCWAAAEGVPNRCRTAEEQQEVAVQFIRDNALQGYLAYQDGKVVGWCNANTRLECYGCISWQFLMKEIRLDECKVKSVFCFEIAPEFRGKGIATRLLERVCRDARQEGFDYVEAYPNAEFTDEQKDFMGPVKMYEKQGFITSYQMENRLVMRKQIRSRA